MMSDGEQYIYENFPNEPSTDDIYVLEAVARDLAGNESRQTCSFSVNQFGSVYTFDQLTEQLLDGNRYLKQGAQMTITETNVMACICRIFCTAITERAGYSRRIRITSFLKRRHWGTGSSIFIRFGKKYFRRMVSMRLQSARRIWHPIIPIPF